MAGDVRVRRATVDDVETRVDAYIAVAAEGRWIGGELPLDRDERIKAFTESATSPDWAGFVAEVDGAFVGELGLHIRRGRGDIGMLVLDGWRGKGVGSALMVAAIDWARANHLHKVTLQVWPHNERAIALYEKFGFEREGYLRKHHRRKTGELWDAIPMGLVLEDA
jgi:RimJ/RimL family protein N-acetyltransferase